MRINVIGILTGIIFLLSACQSGSDPKLIENIESQDADVHIVKAEEVIQANSYTYLRVSEGDESYWIAVSKMDAEEGQTYFYKEGLLMENFESKDLGRTFETIYFVQEISDKPLLSPKKMPAGDVHGERPKIEKREISLEAAKDGITIAELYSNRDSYSGKTVRIRGEVVKFNPEIMGTNWVHIQDGTSDNGNFDLTVTTNDRIAVGDVVTFEGKIALNKDFGAGYTYEVIMEGARQPDLQY